MYIKFVFSCKTIFNAANGQIVYKHVNIESIPVFPIIPVHVNATEFVQRCREAENTGAVYREGMVL